VEVTHRNPSGRLLTGEAESPAGALRMCEHRLRLRAVQEAVSGECAVRCLWSAAASQRSMRCSGDTSLRKRVCRFRQGRDVVVSLQRKTTC